MIFKIKTRAKAATFVAGYFFTVRYLPYKKWSANLIENDIEKQSHKNSDMQKARYCCSIVRKICEPFGNDISCLVQVLAARKLLLSEGISSTLCIGVRRIFDAGSDVEIHAWLEVEGQVLLGKLPGRGFKLLVRRSEET